MRASRGMWSTKFRIQSAGGWDSSVWFVYGSGLIFVSAIFRYTSILDLLLERQLIEETAVIPTPTAEEKLISLATKNYFLDAVKNRLGTVVPQTHELYIAIKNTDTKSRLAKRKVCSIILLVFLLFVFSISLGASMNTSNPYICSCSSTYTNHLTLPMVSSVLFFVLSFWYMVGHFRSESQLISWF